MAGRLTQIALASIGLLTMTVAPGVDSTGLASDWRVVNDSVMGGVSESEVEESGERVIFTGTLSLENNGGFTSARRPVTGDWSTAQSLKMRVKGDGRQYIATMRVQGRAMNRIYYRQPFDTVAGEWIEVELPIDGKAHHEEEGQGAVTQDDSHHHDPRCTVTPTLTLTRTCHGLKSRLP